MSLVAQTKTLIRTRLPEPVWLALKTYGLGLLEIGPPSLQMYLHEENIRSFVGLNNFYSTLAAEIESDSTVELELRGTDGRVLFTHRTRLSYFGSQAIDLSKLLRERGVESPRGLVAVRMAPTRRRHKRFQELGLFLSQFFMFYRDDASGSVAHIHPSSQLERDASPSPPFLSSQIIATRGLRSVVLYQCNPTPKAHRMTMELQDAATRARHAAKTIEVAPLGVARVEFAMTNPVPASLVLSIDALPSGNSKPMLQRRFADNRFSMSHS
jgi:hypothetical protein